MELEKSYNPKKSEEKWYKFWSTRGFFGTDPSKEKKFSIVIPPPNVTGVLHMGHALDFTLHDIIVRWKRMSGYDTLWLPGMDHAGISTHIVVEKLLAKEGKTRWDIGRAEFEKRVWKWKKESGGTIMSQLKRLGASVDWSRERFTLDEGLSKAVRKVFVTLYHEGLIYRDEYMVNWCPRCGTAISDVEVEHTDQDGSLWYIKYPVKGSKKFIIVATTRPETMLGDTAVAVHPDDTRYKKLIGKTVVLPVAGREIPVIADSFVDKEFGTGAVKITPAHDPNDFESAKRNNLPLIRVIGEKGKMTAEAGDFAGMDRFKCRQALVKRLKKEGFLEKIEKYRNAVGQHEKCDTIIEPFVSKQWFVRTKGMAADAIKVVEQKQVRFIPEKWEKVYFEWMHNIRDWCISRQLWWGHQIPAWYCLDCEEINVAEKKPFKCRKCSSMNLKQDEDVLDTWFSSALWPFSTMGWPEETEDLKRYYPTDLLITGFDIIFFWVARMIMAGMKQMGEIPFRDVYIHGLVRDENGQKMSKSRGNSIDPLDLIEKFGTDAVRFTLSSMAVPGTDIPVSENRMEGYRSFTNKIWNATRFVLMNLEDFKGKPELPKKMDPVDCWIISRLNSTAGEVNKALEEYRFHHASEILYHFAWHEVCDWYIELAKPSLTDKKNRKKREAAQAVLVYLMDRLLRLLHPFMPFITEELWQKLPVDGESIIIADYPVADEKMMNPTLEQDFQLIMDVITAIRTIRSEMNINPGLMINVSIKPGQREDLIKTYSANIVSLCRIKNLDTGGAASGETTAKTVVKDIEISVSLEGTVDLAKERARLEKELKTVTDNIESLTKKLSNQGFLDKAPQDVIETNKERYNEALEKKKKIEQNLNNLVEKK